MNLFDAFDKYGLPIVILIMLAIFIKRDVWPFLTLQVQQWQIDRTKERDVFIASLHALQQTAESGHASRAERDRMVNEQLEALAKAVQQVAVLVQHNYNALHLSTPPNKQITPRKTPRRVN